MTDEGFSFIARSSKSNCVENSRALRAKEDVSVELISLRIVCNFGSSPREYRIVVRSRGRAVLKPILAAIRSKSPKPFINSLIFSKRNSPIKLSTICCRVRSSVHSLNGLFSHRDKRRLPIGVFVESIIEIKVFSRPPARLKSISRFLLLAASRITLSPGCSILIPWICGSSAFCVSLA